MENKLRKKIKNKEQTLGMWITQEAPDISEIATMFGLDWICIDTEHGHLNFSDVMNHIRSVKNSETTVLVRPDKIDQGLIKRYLDMGAHGVILPLVKNKAELEQGIEYGRFPLDGVRGLGGQRCVNWGLGLNEYLKNVNEEILIIPMIETKEAAQNIDSILDVPGVEVIFFGPADLSASYGFLGQWEGPGMADLIIDIQKKAQKKGIASGLMCQNADDSIKRKNQGFEMIGLGSDAGLMIRALNTNLEQLNIAPKKHLWF